MTYIYQIIQSAIVGCEIYGLIAIKYELDQFSNAYSNLKSMRSYSYDYVEYYLASKFNEIYYIISTSCSEGNFNTIIHLSNSFCGIQYIFSFIIIIFAVFILLYTEHTM